MMSTEAMNGLSSLNASQGSIQTSMRAFDRSAAAATGPDMVDGIVGMRQAVSDVKAQIAVIKTNDEMLGTLLDMRA
jgi:hypothetical protein